MVHIDRGPPLRNTFVRGGYPGNRVGKQSLGVLEQTAGRRTKSQHNVAAEQVAVTAEQGVLDTEQGVRAAEQGVRAVEQGALDTEQGALDIERGVLDIEWGVLDIEQGVLDIEWGVLAAEQGVLTAEQGVLSAEQGRGVLAAEQGVLASELNSMGAWFRLLRPYQPCQRPDIASSPFFSQPSVSSVLRRMSQCIYDSVSLIPVTHINCFRFCPAGYV